MLIFLDFETGSHRSAGLRFTRSENDLEFLNLLSLPLSARITGKPKNFFIQVITGSLSSAT